MGEDVNHQYDKAFSWELDAHQYTRRYISQSIYYFSGERLVACPARSVEARLIAFCCIIAGLMHWWEVQIARKFCSPGVSVLCDVICEMGTLIAPERMTTDPR